MSDAAEVRQLLMDLAAAMDRGDADVVDGLLSDDETAVAIGTDPEEWWEGGARVKAAIHEQLGGELSVRLDEPAVATEGDVAWFAGRCAFVLRGGRELPFRNTGVCRREGGRWKVVQSHASFGVPNDEVFGG